MGDVLQGLAILLTYIVAVASNPSDVQMKSPFSAALRSVVFERLHRSRYQSPGIGVQKLWPVVENKQSHLRNYKTRMGKQDDGLIDEDMRREELAVEQPVSSVAGNSSGGEGVLFKIGDEEISRRDLLFAPAYLLWGYLLGTTISNAADFPPASFKKIAKEYYGQVQIGDGPLRILEIGAGTKCSSVFEDRFRAGSEVVAVDVDMPDDVTLRNAQEFAAAHDYRFRFVKGDATNLNLFKDESFDAVVCQLTLCSVSSVEKAVSEVRRVLKPGGRFAFVEHVGVIEEDHRPLLGFAQIVLDPLQQVVADNCHLRRNSDQVIVSMFGPSSVVQLTRMSNDKMFPVSQQVAGVVMKA